ncbi:MAG TPA: hypothetical protein VE912_10000 [Bacteroidales bacterium]|nr:hypothetical protein [Bacteroidales bacterium]
MKIHFNFVLFSGLLLFELLILSNTSANCQTIDSPNYALRSHETLRLEKLVQNDTATIFYLSITNQIASGSFCASKHIFVGLPTGKKIWLKQSSGIPVCPQTYQFRHIGEKLAFVLIFPLVEKGTKWLDLVEQCDDACFSIRGIVSDVHLNNQLDKGYACIDEENYRKALEVFEPLAGKYGNSALAGSIYYNLIYIYNKLNDPDHLNFWYDKLSSSNIRDKSIFLQNLEQAGIRK